MTNKNEQMQPDNGDKSIIDHVADKLIDPQETTEQPVVHDSTTRAGKPVEEVVRKQWDPKKKGGLPTFLDRR
jgi:hypothetical protein